MIDSAPQAWAALPEGWANPSLGEIAQINPSLDRRITDDSIKVNFVPMRAVESEGGGLIRPETRTYGEVKKGYTSFLSGDVIMAKITPCMENGKTTVVPELPASVCFGSTEFHVVRPEDGVVPSWIAHFLLQHEVRRTAQRAMTGGVGQMRVPAFFLETMRIPLAPTDEQRRIADALDELLSDLDAGVAALERVRAKLEQYRASVLKAAVEGALTADWRRQHPPSAPAPELLTRMLAERRRRWEGEQLRKFREKGQEPPKNWKAKYKEPLASDTADLPPAAEGWCWATVDQLLASSIMNGLSVRGSEQPPGIPALRLNAMLDGGFDYSAKRYLPLKPEDVDDLWIRAGDFFVSRGNGSKHLVGRGTLAQQPSEPVIFPDTMMRLRFLYGDLSPRWIPVIWSSGFVRRQIERVAKTTAGIWKIAQPDLAGITVPIPPTVEQGAIIEAVEDQLSVIDHLEADVDTKLKSAQGLRQSILRQAFAGLLVPQEPSDEPASKLLKRIAAEREVRARGIRPAKRAGESSSMRRTGRRPRTEANPRNRGH